MEYIINIMIDAFLFFLPAAIANMTPVVAAKYNIAPILKRPLDDGHKLSGIRILGDNKTWRGLMLGVFAGACTSLLQGRGAVIGFALGAGALAGDALKSFIKRRIGIKPGYAFPILDQIDFIIGAIVVALLITNVSREQIIAALFIFGIGSFITSAIAVTMHVKKNL